MRPSSRSCPRRSSGRWRSWRPRRPRQPKPPKRRRSPRASLRLPRGPRAAKRGPGKPAKAGLAPRARARAPGLADPWLIAGLGNPRERYEATPPNIGAMVVVALCETLDTRLRKARFLSALAAEAKYRDAPLLLVRPGTWMNKGRPPTAA